MSFCPTKDIHSIYLDNELPETYKAEYEEHVKNCPKCQKYLKEVKAIRSMLHADSDSLNLGKKELEDSFQRLQVKMIYSKNTSANKKQSNFKLGYIVSAAAAAAVFALVLPFNLKSNSLSSSTENGSLAAAISPLNMNSSAIAANNVSINSGRNVLVSGKISGTVVRPEDEETGSSHLLKTTKAIEVLRPNLGDETISLRIRVPKVGEIPIVTEVNSPMDIMSGKF